MTMDFNRWSCNRIRGKIKEFADNSLSADRATGRANEVLLPPVSRLRALEAITVFASGSLALLACALWLTHPASADGTFNALVALALPIAAISSTALLSYVFRRRTLEAHRARLAEAQLKYKARAELNEARYMEKSDLLEITLGPGYCVR